MRSSLCAVLLLSAFSCEPSFYQRPDYTIWEIPQDADILPMPVKSLETQGDFKFFSFASAELSQRNDGVVQARVQAQEVYYIANDFGGLSAVIVPIVLCYDYAGHTATLSGYQVIKGAKGDLSGCPAETKAPLVIPGVTPSTGPFDPVMLDVTALGQWKETIAVPDVGAAPAFFGEAADFVKVNAEYPRYSAADAVWHRQWVMRGTTKNGHADQVWLDFGPDGTSMLDHVTATTGPMGTETFWQSRDEAVYRIDATSVPLKVQYLGQGVFNLKNPPNVKAAVGATVASLVVGDQWTAMFFTHGKRINLSMRTKTVASTGYTLVQPFRATTASTPTIRSVRVCFNEQLDLSSVNLAAFSLAPAVGIVSVTPSYSNMCVVLGTFPRDEASTYQLTIQNLTSVFGSTLPAHGVRVSLNSDRATLINISSELFSAQAFVESAFATTSGGIIAIANEPDGRFVARAGNDLSFEQRVESIPSSGVDFKADALGHGMWALLPVDGGVPRVMHYDDLPTAAVNVADGSNSIVPIGDGSAIVNSPSGATGRIVQGQLTALPSAFTGFTVTGFVRDSSDVLGAAMGKLQRRAVTDGHLINEWSANTQTRQQVDSYLCSDLLYDASADGGVQMVKVNGGAVNCTDITKDSAGVIYVSSSDFNPEIMYRKEGTQFAALRVRVGSGTTAPYVSHPQFASTGVFFTARAVGGSASVMFVTPADWLMMLDGGTP